MPKIVSIHSFRGGTGKSNTSANLAVILAMEGKRVGVVDTDIQSPGIHVLFNLNEDDMKYSLNDYLWGKCPIKDAAYDVTDNQGPGIKGKIFLVPSSIKTGEIARILKESYDVGMLNDGFHDLIEDLNLDVLVIDTHPGLNEETLLSIAISDALIIVMRPDQQDIQGTSVTVEVARKLDVARIMLVVNKTPQIWNFDDVKSRMEQTYNCVVAAILPHSDELMTLASEGVFAARYPDHEITTKLRKAARLVLDD
ncbi:MAG TPA: MinD/ParA family protein [Aggregatilineales bacterium]|nr:MinD/ParA family protein [Aggregatilineales bacterium]